MNVLIACGFIAFIVCAAAMPLAVKLSRRLGAVSETGGRHIGSKPIGRLGGGGVLFAILSSVFLIIVSVPTVRSGFYDVQRKMIGLSLGLIVVATIGFWDDIRRLPAFLKFIGQIIAASFAYFFGLKISGVDLPFIEPVQLGFFSFPVTALWIIGIVNAVNLIDGLDGLAGGVVLFAGIVNLTAALVSGAFVPAVLMVAMVGSILGFLLFNWHPAKIYLGDGGAYSIGFILSISGLLAPVQKASTGIALLVPLIAMGLPIFDTLLTMLRRYMSDRGIFSPDRGHLHHILFDAGISHRRVVIGLYLVCCVLCSIALIMVLKRNMRVGGILIVLSLIGVVLWGWSVKSQLSRVIAGVFRFESAPERRSDELK